MNFTSMDSEHLKYIYVYINIYKVYKLIQIKNYYNKYDELSFAIVNTQKVVRFVDNWQQIIKQNSGRTLVSDDYKLI